MIGRYFALFGDRSIIYKAARIMGAANISIGKSVTINMGAYLYALEIAEQKPKLIIGDGVTIGFYSHIVAVDEVIIEKNVLIADKVYIGDNSHIYDDIQIPIIEQGVRSTGKTEIGEGSWIGDNVSIVSSKIGKHCVIGSNSVVNKDIPDYCVAVGNPAVVVKRYNFENRKWERV